jgi:DNA-binding transcriptional MerR regulator
VATIPNRPAFRSQEVCEIAEVQPYVLRGWEAEFPDLGVAKAPNGPRVYRRADVERVLKLKHLIQVEGLTLAGARRRLEEQNEPDLFNEVAQAEEAAANQVRATARVTKPKAEAPIGNAARNGSVSPAVSNEASDDARAHLQEAREGLQWILNTLNSGNGSASEFALAASSARAKRSRKVVK